MKILNPQSAVLSNLDVLTHLSPPRPPTSSSTSPPPSTTTPSKTTTPTPTMKSPNYETVIRECRHYLSSTLALSAPAPAPNSPKNPNPPSPTTTSTNPTSTKTLLTSLHPYALTKSELLMLVNLRPADLGFLDAVVEECDGRFSEEEQGKILGVVSGTV